MSLSGSTFIDFTEWLQEQDSCKSEIGFRSCVNRAYYGAFHITKDYLIKSFSIINSEASHREIIKKLKREDEFLGNKLYMFFEERKDADYMLGKPLSQKKAERLVKDIKIFIKELEND